MTQNKQITTLDFIALYAAAAADSAHSLDAVKAKLNPQHIADLSASYEAQQKFRRHMYICYIARRIGQSSGAAATPEANLAQAENVFKLSGKERSDIENKWYERCRRDWKDLLDNAEIPNLDPRAGNKNASKQAGDKVEEHSDNEVAPVVAKSPPKQKDTRPVRYETTEAFNGYLMALVTDLGLHLDANSANVSPKFEKQIRAFIKTVKSEVENN